MTSQSDYRQILKQELSSRTRANPQFSLRAFARTLEMTPAQLSAVLNQKYGLSPQKAERIALKLGYSQKEKDLFRTLVEKQHARSKAQRDAAAFKLEKLNTPGSYDTVEQDAFEAISNWFHFAIVELTRVEGFKSDASWIGKKLGISTIDADLAIERLKRLGLLKLEKAKLVPSQEFYGSSPGVPSRARREFQSQVLKKAIQAVTLHAFERRTVSSTVMAVSSARVAEVRALAEEFRLKVDDILSKDDKKDSVYCLSVAFFDLGGEAGSDA